MPRNEQSTGADSQPGYVKLVRRFRAIEATEAKARAAAAAREKAAILHYTISGELLDTDLKWEEVLSHPLGVILGEPGSGKTWEFRERTRSIRAGGGLAFFIRLDGLVGEPLSTSQCAAEQSLFAKWKRGRRKATFLVDSVDEAKFGRPSDFQRAVDRLRLALGDLGQDRMQIILSSRISEWSPEADAVYVSNSFPSLLPPPQEGKERERLFVAQISPLDRAQVIKFAQEKGVTDHDLFVAALDQAHAWELARRPIDVADLLNFWLTNRRLGSLQEIIEFSVRNGLTETQERRTQDPLTGERAWEGAETLAAAAILCREFNIRIPDNSHISEAPGINASLCLAANWTGEEQQSLLTRPIFDSATYGRIRFHHRRLIEYLCARWWGHLFDEGLTSLDLENIMFATTSLGQVLRPSLAAVAAWLANGENIWNHKIRALLLKNAPEVFLSYGDASGLTVEYKKRVISAILENFRVKRKTWAPTEWDAISRLADPSLAGFLSTNLLDPTFTDDMREFVLKLIRGGSVHQCGDAVLSIISNPNTSDDTRAYAVYAIRDCATLEQRRRLTEMALALPTVSPFVAARVCEAAFPRAMTAAQLKFFLSRLEEERDKTANLPYYLTSLFEKVVTPDTSSELLIALVQLAKTEPTASDEHGREPISQQFRWIRKTIPTVLLKLLSKAALTDAEMETAYSAIEIVGAFPRQYSVEMKVSEELRRCINHHADLRRFYFWRRTQRLRARGQVVKLTDICEMQSLFELRKNDWPWVMEDVASKTVPEDARLSFDCGWQLLYDRGCSIVDTIHFYRQLRDEELRKVFRSSLRPVFLWAIKRRWLRFPIANLFQKYWWQRLRHRAMEEWWLVEARLRLLLRYFPLKRGKYPGWLYSLAEEAHESNKWGVSDWSRVRKDYGPLLSAAAREGCKAFWRTYQPDLPHDRTDPNSIPKAIIIGLSGLNAEIKDAPETLISLSDSEATTATRYAVNEMNGFTWWLPAVAALKPGPVLTVLEICLQKEWLWPSNLNNPQGVLAKLVWNGEGLRNLIGPSLKGAFRENDPPNTAVLRQALRLLVSEELDGAELLKQLAPVRIVLYPPENPAWYLWASVWLQVDAIPAIDYLESVVPRTQNPTQLFVALCTTLAGERGGDLPVLKRPSFLRTNALRRFIPLVFAHIRLADDVRHVGGFTPDARDDAGRFRDALVYQLAQSEDEDAASILLALRQEPFLATCLDWLNTLYEKRLVERSEAAPWKEEDIREFRETHEKEPRNDQDLFRIAVKRLQALAHEVENSDNSPRSELSPEQTEAFLRRWVTRKLRENARGRYTSPEESEIDFERYPDIRIEKPGINPVSIEIKWADRWTIPQLMEGLEVQLVGRYLRSHTSRFGIYLLGYIGRKGTWEQEEGPNLSFVEVVNLMRLRAHTLAEQRPGELGLEVISIDFTH